MKHSEETITPKETRLILEILELPQKEVADAINCDKADLTACINQRKRNRRVSKDFANFVSEQLRAKLLAAGEVIQSAPDPASRKRVLREPATVPRDTTL